MCSVIMKTAKKKEYLIWEWPNEYKFRVWICEDSVRIDERWFYSLSTLLSDAAKWHIANPGCTVGLETRAGNVITLAPKEARLDDF